MFNGHIDTMPPGNESLWNSPPFEPVIKDGKLYGLGVCDMKGGLMASVMAVKLLRDANIPLPVDVVITSVVDEEGGGNGSIAAAVNGRRADTVVVCEPTEQKLIIANMGFVFFKVEVKGLAVHSASKWLGVSAIEKARKIINALDELEHKWLLTHKHPLLPPPSSNVGVIEGGVAGSTIADYCMFKTCVHYHPKTMNHKDVVREYEYAIYRCCEGDDWLKEEHEITSGLPKEWPAVLGYNKTEPLDCGEILVKVGDDPLVAVGSFGKGKSAVFTTDCAPHWAPEAFVNWEYYDVVWKNILDYLMK